MRLARNFVDQPLIPGERITLPARVHHHLHQVLRLKSGDPLLLFNGRDGRDYSARLTRMDRKGGEAEILEMGEEEPTPPLSLTLALGISKGERMDFALQKSVELGVSIIQPLFTERTVVKLDDKRLARRLAHWRGVVISACEQSGRRWLPDLRPPQRLDKWLEKGHQGNLLLLDPGAQQTLPGLVSTENKFILLVGPEGGLSDKERESAYLRGWRGIRLGPRVLRSETAPLAALAAIQVLWGDFRD